MAKPPATQLVVCIDNAGYTASLERRKLYFAVRDPEAEKHGLLRVVDKSGEDYLYPKAFFRRNGSAARASKSLVRRIRFRSIL